MFAFAKFLRVIRERSGTLYQEPYLNKVNNNLTGYVQAGVPAVNNCRTKVDDAPKPGN